MNGWYPVKGSSLDSPAIGECVRCGRSTWTPGDIGTEDRMTQPGGGPCGGTFVEVR